MSYEAQISIRQGEIEPVYGQIMAQAGDTLTIQSAPTLPYTAPRFSLLNSAGLPIITNAAIAPGNYTPGAAAVVLFWYVLDTTSLTPGAYVARLTAAVKSTADGITRQKISEVQISVLGGVEIAATYDVTTSLGQARLYCLDADVADSVFSDAEMQQFLSDAGGVPVLAASLALEMLAVDNLRLSNAIRIGAYKNTSSSPYTALVERAARLRALAVVPCSVAATSQVFSVSTDSDNSGSIDLW